MKQHPNNTPDLKLPPIIFGTSSLGNLYQELPYHIKLDILRKMFDNLDGTVVLDTAGKYGAGLALEIIGKGLKDLEIPAGRVLISNKLGWYRIPLETPESTFEPGAWKGLKHDAIQKISYDGILECWEQGSRLLGTDYKMDLVSVHDPDEYLFQASDNSERKTILENVVGAYRALNELKNQNQIKYVGIGAKDWKSIKELSDHVELDWVMLANSYTIFNHPPELLEFVDDLQQKGIQVINSAVFHGGFLTGSGYFNYRPVEENNPDDKHLFVWREKFFSLCKSFKIAPSDACVQFGMSHPAVVSIAMNTSKPERIKDNIASVIGKLPDDFWAALKKEGLIDTTYPYLD